MKKYSQQQLVELAQLSLADLNEINQRRQPYTRLGFAYQLAFVRLYNRFPSQIPFELEEELLTFVGVQLKIPPESIHDYTQRRETIAEHQPSIRVYLGLRRFGDAEIERLNQFLFDEACRLEQTSALLTKAEHFLQEQKILCPAQDTLVRLIVHQREQSRQHIYQRIIDSLTLDQQGNLDKLIEVDKRRLAPLQALKEAPKRASPSAMLHLLEKLDAIEKTGVLTLDLVWLNNNYQRSLTRYVKRCSANRLRELQVPRRYAVLVCFLWQTYRDTIDYAVDMHDKIMTSVYRQAEKEIDEYARTQRRSLRESLSTLKTVSQVILDDAIDDQDLRNELFRKVTPAELATQMVAIEEWLSGKHSHVFHLVVKRFSYLRQFAPALLKHLRFQSENEGNASLLEAIHLLQGMNEENKRKLPDDAPIDFLPKPIQDMVLSDGEVSKAAWECALLNAVRDEIKAGNIHVHHSKRFGRFDNFFIPEAEWHAMREAFFKRAGLPTCSEEVESYLTQRLNQAYDRFLAHLPANAYAQVNEAGWQLSTDPGEKFDLRTQARLETLQKWLSEQMRVVKLPELLIQVDNDLHFTNFFMPLAQQGKRYTEEVCIILSTLMAHGCNIGPYNMARLVENISYEQIKRVTDWQLTEEAQRSALAQVVNALSNLKVTQMWGAGKTSSSDGQRFSYHQKVLQRTYSHQLNDFAIEFYSFVADNYAPFYSIPIECTDRDAAYVLDGLLYNESDLALAEHYTDTHGYTEINFAAFALLGKRFTPRIRNLKKQRIYRIDSDKDYQSLSPLLDPRDRTIHIDWICDQWDRMGHFYASLASGHATASTALNRLVAYSGKNHFYRANRELGRVFKTEHILRFISDPLVRQQNRRGLLKGEQVHALAREVGYGKQGRITARDLHEQRNSCNCLTLMMACIIYWQAKEINRVINECDPELAEIDVSLLEHISPIEWENVILYGEYVLNRDLIQI